MKVLKNLFGNNTKISASDIAIKDSNNKARILDKSVIVDSGSNENGSWVKWADGTMVVLQEYFDTKTIYVTMGSLKRVGLKAPPDFPQEFKEPPIVQITLQHAWLAWLMGIEGNATTTNATGKELIPIASVEQTTLTDVKIHILAIGKWQ
jgi:hypothetical protein